MLKIPCWKNVIENIDPEMFREILDVSVYQANEERFAAEGFTRDIFAKVSSLVEDTVWSTFWLFKLAQAAAQHAKETKANLLEIGSGRGGSITTMGFAAPTAGLINIDKFCPFDETSCYGTLKGYQGFSYLDFQRNTSVYPQIRDRIGTILKWSDEAINDVYDGTCELVYIDGNHTYEYIRNDIKNYLQKLRDPKTSIIAGHDYHPLFPGVIKAVKEAFGDNFVVCENSSVWAVKNDIIQ